MLRNHMVCATNTSYQKGMLGLTFLDTNKQIEHIILHCFQ